MSEERWSHLRHGGSLGTSVTIGYEELLLELTVKNPDLLSEASSYTSVKFEVPKVSNGSNK